MTHDTWTVTGPWTVGVEHVTSLDVTLVGGRVDVVAHDDPARTDAVVEVHAVTGRAVEVTRDGAALRIGYGSFAGGWKGFVERFRTYSGKDAAEVHVAVPLTARVRLATVQGDGLVAGVRQDVRVATVSGALVTSRTTGALRVDTVSGEVSVSDHDGAVRMDSVSGGLTATGALRELRLDSISGAVTVDTRTTPDEVQVSAVSADVLVRLPDPDAMEYEIRCVSGRLVVDGAEQRGTATSFVRPARDGSGRPVRVSAVSGNVTVLRGATGEQATADVVEDAPVEHDRSDRDVRGDAAGPAWGTPVPGAAAPTTGPVDR